MTKRNGSILLLVMVTLLAAALLGRWTIAEVGADAGAYEDLKIFTEVLSAVNNNYVEEIDTKALIYNSIRGMLRSLDPHSAFLSPDEYKEMKVDTKGEFGGLGIQISMKDGVLTVIAPIEDTPAWSAGIEAGDKIIKIDGESTADMTLQDAVSKMRGAKGTSVTISIARDGMKKLKDYTIVRDIIKIKSVKFKVIEEGIGYIKLNQFQERSADDMKKAIEALKKENINALVLDLRNNPGGLLKSAVDVSGLFLPPGKLVVYIKARSGDKTEYMTEGDYYFDLPMVVLVNQGSASASEIVAGALKDWKRAVILGVTTFGKGSVQSILPLSDNSGLRLTTAKYYTPKGISIQNTGISPDIVEKLKAADGTSEHAVMREKDLRGHLTNEQVSEEPQEGGEADVEEDEDAEKMVFGKIEEKDDNQLQRALDLLKTWTIFKEMVPDQPLEAVGN